MKFGILIDEAGRERPLSKFVQFLYGEARSRAAQTRFPSVSLNFAIISTRWPHRWRIRSRQMCFMPGHGIFHCREAALFPDDVPVAVSKA